MSRQLRAQVPGGLFHIIGRLHAKQPWFKDRLEPVVQAQIIEGMRTSDAQLLAYAVMSNHLHIVMRQGARSLGWVLQPIFRRIALRVQARRGYDGHVFERPFRSYLCDHGLYARRVVGYVHLNPVRAGVCSSPHEYAYTSHAWLTEAGVGEEPGRTHVLRLFAELDSDDDEQCRQHYLAYLAWRVRKDACDEAGEPFNEPEPSAAAGDRYFGQVFTVSSQTTELKKIDLRDRARQHLERREPLLQLEALKGPWLSQPLQRVRDEIIRKLLLEEYVGRRIAEFFRISDTTVSDISRKVRFQAVIGE